MIPWEPARAKAKALGLNVTGNAEVAIVSEIIVVAVKPDVVASALAPLELRGKLVVSIAAGVPLMAIEIAAGNGARCVRTMPNTPCLVGEAAVGVARHDHGHRCRRRDGDGAVPRCRRRSPREAVECCYSCEWLRTGLHLFIDRGPCRRGREGGLTASHRVKARGPNRKGRGGHAARHGDAPRPAQGSGLFSGRDDHCGSVCLRKKTASATRPSRP